MTRNNLQYIYHPEFEEWIQIIPESPMINTITIHVDETVMESVIYFAPINNHSFETKFGRVELFS